MNINESADVQYEPEVNKIVEYWKVTRTGFIQRKQGRCITNTAFVKTI